MELNDQSHQRLSNPDCYHSEIGSGPVGFSLVEEVAAISAGGESTEPSVKSDSVVVELPVGKLGSGKRMARGDGLGVCTQETGAGRNDRPPLAEWLSGSSAELETGNANVIADESPRLRRLKPASFGSGALKVPNTTQIQFGFEAEETLLKTNAYKLFTKTAQSSGLENIGSQRPLSSLLAPRPVLSPSRITLENNEKIRSEPDLENAFARASGGGRGLIR